MVPRKERQARAAAKLVSVMAELEVSLKSVLKDVKEKKDMRNAGELFARVTALMEKRCPQEADMLRKALIAFRPRARELVEDRALEIDLEKEKQKFKDNQESWQEEKNDTGK